MEEEAEDKWKENKGKSAEDRKERKWIWGNRIGRRGKGKRIGSKGR